jgi:hypothetical protein
MKRFSSLHMTEGAASAVDDMESCLLVAADSKNLQALLRPDRNKMLAIPHQCS